MSTANSDTIPTPTALLASKNIPSIIEIAAAELKPLLDNTWKQLKQAILETFVGQAYIECVVMPTPRQVHCLNDWCNAMKKKCKKDAVGWHWVKPEVTSVNSSQRDDTTGKWTHKFTVVWVMRIEPIYM